MHVVATAGHVDHGKSTLVRALTGRNPDRLAQEQQRGLTIELGYCWTTLKDVGGVAFVDVPGHEGFVATMLAGVGPVPVVLFVVAADDPWMPQAAEHLAALDALDVRQGVLVVTRSDLADPSPMASRARAELAATSLRDAPCVVVSGRTGDGLEELRSKLAAVLLTVPQSDPGADVRLWVDRRFHITGAGTIVTGTLTAGTVAVGDRLECGDTTIRIRRIESLEIARERVSGVARVALEVGGRAPSVLARGSALVTPRAFMHTAVVDVRVAGGGDGLPAQPVMHVGAALVGSRVRPLGGGYVRLTLERVLPLRVGDRALLRDPGRRAVWGVRVVDPVPPSLSRRGSAAARSRDLASLDGSPAAELRLRRVVRRSMLVRTGVSLDPLPSGTVAVGDWLIDPVRVAELRSELATLVSERAVTPSEAARVLGLPDPEVALAIADRPLALKGGRIVDASQPELPADLRTAAELLCAELSGFAAPTASRLSELGLDRRAVNRLHHAGVLLRVDDRVVLLPSADERAVEVLRDLPQPFSASEARRSLGTTRRVALALLTHLDRGGRTVRLADDTRHLRTES